MAYKGIHTYRQNVLYIYLTISGTGRKKTYMPDCAYLREARLLKDTDASAPGILCETRRGAVPEP